MSFVNSSVASAVAQLLRLVDDAACVDVRVTNATSGTERKEPVRPELLRRIIRRQIAAGVPAFEGVTLSEARVAALHEHNLQCAVAAHEDGTATRSVEPEHEEAEDLFAMEEAEGRRRGRGLRALGSTRCASP